MKNISTSRNQKLKLAKQAIGKFNTVVKNTADPNGNTPPTTNISYIADCFSQIALNCPVQTA